MNRIRRENMVLALGGKWATQFRIGWVLICCMFLFGINFAQAQLPWDKMRSKNVTYQVDGETRTAEVQIAYTVHPKGKPGNRAGIRTLGQKIDLLKYPEAIITTWIRVVRIPPGQKVFVCDACFENTFVGFNKTSSLNKNKRTLSSNEALGIEYRYNPDLLKGKDKGNIKFGFHVINKDAREISLKDHSDYVEYALLNIESPTSSNNSDLEVLIADIQESPGTYCGSHEMSKILSSDKVSGQIKERISKLCNEYDPSTSKKPAQTSNGGAKPSNGNTAAAAQKIAEDKAKQKEKFDRIKKNFKIEETGTRQEREGKVWVQFYMSGLEGEKPLVTANSNDVEAKPTNPEETKYLVTVPPKTERRLSITLKGVTLKSFPINTRVQPVSAIFSPGETEEQLTITIKDGEAPYTLYIYEGETYAGQIEIGRNKTYDLDGKKFAASGLSGGKYSLRVVDKSKILNNNAQYHDTYSYSSFNWNLLIWPLILLVLGAAVYFLYSSYYRKQQVSDEYLNKLKKPEVASVMKKAVEATGNGGGNQRKIRSKITISNKGGLKTEHADSILTSESLVRKPHPNLGIVSAAEVPANFLKHPPHKYRKIVMDEMWTETAVSSIYISEVCAGHIHNFVFEDSKPLHTLKGENIPEIGGWLLGKVELDDNNGIIVSFERFVEINRPHDNSETRIAFGASAWAELERQRDMYQADKLELVGWFHTHPGWGVFLSGEDINTHMTYFQKPFHIAMELDSVSDHNDVGFFSWQKTKSTTDGFAGEGLNNKPELKGDWFKWSDFRQWIS